MAKKSNPDLVILDLGLPAGGGRFVLETLQKDPDLVTTPVIILSARPAKENEDFFKEFEVATYLEKPAGSDALLLSIKCALETEDSQPATGRAISFHGSSASTLAGSQL